MNGSARRFVTGCGHEGVLQLPGDPPDVEHAVAPLHAFQVDRGDVHAVAEQEVRRGGVTVQPDLLVLPHPGPAPPQIAQPAQLFGVPLTDAPRFGAADRPPSSKYRQSISKSTCSPFAVRLCCVAR